MTERQAKLLASAESMLTYAADGAGHYCEEEGCCAESPQCRDMHLQAGLKKLSEALEPAHVGLHPRRMCFTPERIYAEYWQKNNERQHGINHGYTLIEHILCPQDQKWPERVSNRDAEVAACVVQWLGTPIGNCMIRACERQIEEASAERATWRDFTLLNVALPTGDKKTAELIAERAMGLRSDIHAALVRDIVGPLQLARKNAVKVAMENYLKAV